MAQLGQGGAEGVIGGSPTGYPGNFELHVDGLPVQHQQWFWFIIIALILLGLLHFHVKLGGKG
jgi:hypothetical protein